MRVVLEFEELSSKVTAELTSLSIGWRGVDSTNRDGLERECLKIESQAYEIEIKG